MLYKSVLIKMFGSIKLPPFRFRFPPLIFIIILTYCLVAQISQSQSNRIKIPAFGRMEGLGSMYDIRKNVFTGVNVFNLVNEIPAIPSAYKTKMDKKVTTTNVDIIDTLEDKLRLLKIPPDLAVSILSGQLDVDKEGSSVISYLNQCNTINKDCSSTSTQVTMLRQIMAIQESVQPCDEGLSEHYNESILKFEMMSATHVVVGITWGGNFIFSFENPYENNNEYDHDGGHQQTEGSPSIDNINEVFHIIKNYPQYNFTNTNTKTETSTMKINIQTFSDIAISETHIQNFADLTQLLEKANDVLNGINRGKGVPIYYEIMPLTKIRKCLAEEFLHLSSSDSLNIENISETSLANLTEIFNWISIVQQKAFSLSKKIQSNLICLTDEENCFLQNLKAEFLEGVHIFKFTIANALFLVRSGLRNQSFLENLIRNYKEKNPVSVYHVNQKVDVTRNRVFEKIQLYHMFRNHGVQYIGRSAFLQNEILKYNSDEMVYVMFIKTAFRMLDPTSWMTNVTFFFDITSSSASRNSNTGKGIVVDCDFEINLQCKEISRTNHTVIRKFHKGIWNLVDVNFIKNENESQILKKFQIVEDTLKCPCLSEDIHYNNKNDIAEETTHVSSQSFQNSTSPSPVQTEVGVATDQEEKETLNLKDDLCLTHDTAEANQNLALTPKQGCSAASASYSAASESGPLLPPRVFLWMIVTSLHIQLN